MKRLNILILLLLGIGYFSNPAYATIRLPAIFQSNMVLQRGQDIKLWGYGNSGEKVRVSFNELVLETTTDKAKKWQVSLPAQPAGGPYRIVIKGSENDILLENILFGDVWICGGQSNMQYTLSQIGYQVQEKDTADSRIRIFQVAIGQDYVPREELSGGIWQEGTAENLPNTSAAAFFFGRFLQDSLKVPIGLVSVNLGATTIETWMSGDALASFPQFSDYHRLYLSPGKSSETIISEFEKMKPSWQQKYYLKGEGIEQKWYLPETDVSDWKKISIPSWWEDQEIGEFDGAVWMRKTFDLPEGVEGDTFTLALNQIDDYDITWVNGHKVGETYGNQNWRNYQVPMSILKPTGNVITVRAFDTGGKGGFYSNAIWGNPILVGDWLYKLDNKIDASEFPKPHVVNSSPFSSPAVLFNANVAPLTSLAVKGIIWYQGESNASRADEYSVLFPALISDWRKHFDQGSLPFLFVQLANYGAEEVVSGESNWAELREAQALALKIENTGMAVAIDIGEASDIHPRNKMDVGKRLGLAALNVAYERDIGWRGPTFESLQFINDTAVVYFQSGTDQLRTKNKYGYVSGFSVAGADKVFHWAQASISGNTVLVTSKDVKSPMYLRYAWADNPGLVDLYNADDLPAVPFRSDDLPRQTSGVKFTMDPWMN